MRAALYLRVSTARQAEKDLSIPDQRRQADAYCRKKGWEIAAEYEEPGASATDDKRPVFQRMIEEARRAARPFDVIVVHSYSRFFRDAFQLEFYLRSLQKVGVKLVSITQEAGDDPMSHLIRQVVALFDEYSSRENGKHTLRAMQENARRGFWNGSKPPYGYRVVEAERRGDKVKKRLDINPQEAEIVGRIFDWYRHGTGNGPVGVKGIADRLNRQGLRFRDGRKFSTGLVYRLLTRTTYKGEHYFNRQSFKTGRAKPPSEWVAFPVLPIVEASVFDAVQGLLAQRNPKHTPPRIVSGPTLLAGLARCATCGGGMVIRTGKSGRYRYYTCSTCSTCARQGKTACQGRSVPMSMLDDLVIGHVADRIFVPDRLKALLSELSERARHGQGNRLEKVKALNAEKRETERSLERLYEAIERGVTDINDDTLRQRISNLRQRRDEQIRLTSMLERQGAAPLAVLSPKKLEAFAVAMRERLTSPNTAYRKSYRRLFVDRVEVDDSEIRIFGPKSALARGATEPEQMEKGEVPTSVQEWRAVGGWAARGWLASAAVAVAGALKLLLDLEESRQVAALAAGGPMQEGVVDPPHLPRARPTAG